MEGQIGERPAYVRMWPDQSTKTGFMESVESLGNGSPRPRSQGSQIPFQVPSRQEQKQDILETSRREEFTRIYMYCRQSVMETAWYGFLALSTF